MSVNKNDNIPLYTKSLSGGPGNDPNSIVIGDDLQTFIRGDLYKIDVSNSPLYINVPATGYTNLGSDLFIKVDEPIIGVGGIHSAQDAIDKLEAGASLVQLYTGFVYNGPALIKKINKRLLEQNSIS